MATAGGLEHRSEPAQAAQGRLRQFASLLTLTPITTVIWLAMIALAGAGIAWAGLSWWWLPIIAYAVLAIHELLAFALFHRGLFPSAERVARVYEWFTLFLGDRPDLQQRGDLTEGLFDGDFGKSIEQATLDKYRRIADLLGLMPGMRVLDVGCGLGDFLSFLAAHGISGTGLTLSPDQQRIAASRGLDVRVCDFRRPLDADLQGKFDAVTLIGSLEHFCTSYEMADRAGADRVFAAVFRSANQALAPASACGRVFSATLHSTAPSDWALSDWLHAYSFHAHYSGLYPRIGDFERLCEPWLDVVHREDRTIDYQYSSLAAHNHFGDFKVAWNPARLAQAILLLLVNPFAPWSWVYHGRRSWLWQFGGDDIHTTRTRPARALWYVHQRAPG
jgi:cyclopropane fatty-acyl-phospholipid synthase-like methyltransferase